MQFSILDIRNALSETVPRVQSMDRFWLMSDSQLQNFTQNMIKIYEADKAIARRKKREEEDND